MGDITGHTDEEIFTEYSKRCREVAEDIIDHLNDNMEHESIDGRRWCEDNDIPQSVFSDAIEYHVAGVQYGISPMYPFRVDGKATLFGERNS